MARTIAVYQGQTAGQWLGVVAFLILGIVGGLAIGFIGPTAGLFLSAMVLGAAGLLLPLRHLVLLTIIVAYIVMGQLVYFARVDKAIWLPFLLGLAILVRLPGDMMQRRLSAPHQSPYAPAQSGPVSVLIAVYFLTVVATTVINQNGFLQVFISSKEYVFLWSIYLAITAGLVAPDLLKRIWHLLPWLLPLQLPLIFYQRFVVAARRAVSRMGAEWDAVVGAFGGDPDGGGSSGAMSLFVVFAMVLAITRWRNGTMKPAHCALIVGSGLLTLALAEVKFAVLMLPVAIFFAFRREFLARPVAALLALVASAAIAGGTLYLYKQQYSNAEIDRSQAGYFEHMFSASTDDSFINHRTGEIGRVAAIKFWAQQQTSAVEMLIGQGMGSSRKGDMAVGEAARKWMFNIARSSLAIMLWETGLLGTAAFVAMLGFAYLRAHSLAVNPRTSTEDRPLLAACAAGFVLLAAELPYNTDIYYSPQIQILLMLMLGQVAISGGAIGANRREQQ